MIHSNEKEINVERPRSTMKEYKLLLVIVVPGVHRHVKYEETVRDVCTVSDKSLYSQGAFYNSLKHDAFVKTVYFWTFQRTE